MRKRKHPKLRAYGRWGVWLCALISIGLLYNRGRVELTNGKLGPVSISILDSAVSISHTQHVQGPVNPKQFPSLQFNCGYGSELLPRTYSQSTPTWNVVRSTQATGPVVVRNFQMPTMYISVVFVLWSLWLLRGCRMMREEGCCSKCEYSLEGLSSGVCPECGEQYA